MTEKAALWHDILPAGLSLQDLLEEDALRKEREHAELVEDIAAIRAFIRSISPVLVAVCAEEGLPIAR